MGEKAQRDKWQLLAQSLVTDRPGQLLALSLYINRPLGSILGIKFPRENHEEIVRERRRERGRRLEEEPVVVVFDLFRPSSDRVKQVLENGYHTEGEGEGTSAWKMNP